MFWLLMYKQFLLNEFLFYSYWDEQIIYVLIYFTVSFLITTLLIGVGFSLSTKDISFEKISSYECGFEPFGDSHSIFNIQYFVVGILFMLFDLELAYLFPWVLNLGNLSIFSFFVMFLFLFLLTIGFIYEWNKGALDWL